MWSTFQQPGDILFTRSHTFGGQLNLLAQRTLTLRRAGATHVILCIAPGLYIHSNKGRGVEFDRAEDLPLTVVPMAGESCLHRAVRPNFAGETSSRFVELMNKALYFYRQRYNVYFFAKRRLTSNRYRESAAYCSEFVAAVHRSMGLPLVEAEDAKVLPSTLEAALVAPGWTDVTDEYRRGLQSVAEATDREAFHEPLRDLVFRTLGVNATLLQMTALNRQLDGLAKAIIDSGDVEALGELKSSLEQLADLPDDPIDRYLDLLEGIVDCKQLEPLHFAQQVDPTLAFKALDAMIGELEAVFRKEIEVLDAAIATAARFNDTVDTLVSRLVGSLNDERGEPDPTRIAEYASALSTLVSPEADEALRTALEQLAPAGIDAGEELDVAPVVARLDELKPAVEGRPELSGSIELFFRCLRRRLSLHEEGVRIVRFRDLRPELRRRSVGGG